MSGEVGADRGPRLLTNAFGVIGLLVLLFVALFVLMTLHFLGLTLLGVVALAASLIAERGAVVDPTPREVAERLRLRHFVRFYRHCAVLLIAMGLAGLATKHAGWTRW